MERRRYSWAFSRDDVPTCGSVDWGDVAMKSAGRAENALLRMLSEAEVWPMFSASSVANDAPLFTGSCCFSSSN
jgi:hypothetical protein